MVVSFVVRAPGILHPHHRPPGRGAVPPPESPERPSPRHWVRSSCGGAMHPLSRSSYRIDVRRGDVGILIHYVDPAVLDGSAVHFFDVLLARRGLVVGTDSVQLPLLLDVGLRVAAEHRREGQEHLHEDGQREDHAQQADQADTDSDDARHGDDERLREDWLQY